MMSHAQAGWSLTELMIATALAGLLISGAIGAYLGTSAAFREAGAEQRLRERAQYAFATLGNDVLLAGYFGAGLPPRPLTEADVPAAARTCGMELLTRLDQPLQVAPDYALACPAAAGGALASHTLVVRRVATRTATPRAGRALWLAQMLPPWNQWLLWDGTLPAGITADPPHVELRELVIRHYYIARQSDGDNTTPSLRVKTLTEIAGQPGFMDTEVMHGIEAMQITLLPDATAPRAVHITLQLRDEASGASGRSAQRLSVSRHFAIRNAPLPG